MMWMLSQTLKVTDCLRKLLILCQGPLLPQQVLCYIADDKSADAAAVYAARTGVFDDTLDEDALGFHMAALEEERKLHTQQMHKLATRHDGNIEHHAAHHTAVDQQHAHHRNATTNAAAVQTVTGAINNQAAAAAQNNQPKTRPSWVHRG